MAKGNTPAGQAMFEGEWKDGKRNGQGEDIINGRVYDGEWEDDQFHIGKITYTDGSVFEGGLKDNLIRSQGQYYFVNGCVYDGEWKDDTFHKGKMTYITIPFARENGAIASSMAKESAPMQMVLLKMGCGKIMSTHQNLWR